MGKCMIIGCGGVASVAIHKCCQNSEVFEGIMIASRTKSKCDALKEKLQPTTKTVISSSLLPSSEVKIIPPKRGLIALVVCRSSLSIFRSALAKNLQFSFFQFSILFAIYLSFI